MTPRPERKTEAPVSHEQNTKDIDALWKQVSSLKTSQVQQDGKLDNLTATTSRIELHMVTKEAFLPVRNAVYGLIALICAGFIGAILAFVWERGP